MNATKTIFFAESEETIQEYTPKIKNLATIQMKKYPFLHNVVSADDIVQEVWIKILNNPDTTRYEPGKGASVTTFLTLICSSVIKDIIRFHEGTQRRIPYSSLCSIYTTPDNIVDDRIGYYYYENIEDDTLSRQFEEVEFSVGLEELQDALLESEKLTERVTLEDVCRRLIDGYSVAEISREFGISPGCVHRFIKRSKDRITQVAG